MKNYVLTAFTKSGEKLLDESFTAENDEQAKQKGKELLKKEGFEEHTHRLVTEDARLILFHR